MTQYRAREVVDAIQWTGDREAVLAWAARFSGLHVEFVKDPAPGDTASLITWAPDPYLPGARIYGDQIFLDEWIVRKWTGRLFRCVRFRDNTFRDAFEEVS